MDKCVWMLITSLMAMTSLSLALFFPTRLLPGELTGDARSGGLFGLRSQIKTWSSYASESCGDCSLGEDRRHRCGASAISKESCHTQGCCWQRSPQSNIPNCFHPATTLMPGCLSDNEKVVCGPDDVTRDHCVSLGCCWQPSGQPNVPWCYGASRVPVYGGECGGPAIPPNVQTRIVGGVEATPNSWPWMASLQWAGNHICGASLVNNQWLISAAHCDLSLYGINDTEIVLGMHDLEDEAEENLRIEIEYMIKHELYDPFMISNDIMVIKLSEPVEFTDTISPVCAPDPKADYPEGLRCYTTGWGALQSQGSSPDRLQQVMVPLISTAKCNQTDWYDGEIDQSMICAGYMEGGRDSCQGDSGGPLVCQREDKWELVGIVSWGYGCASEKKPGVYSRVTHLLDWAERTIALNS